METSGHSFIIAVCFSRLRSTWLVDLRAGLGGNWHAECASRLMKWKKTSNGARRNPERSLEIIENESVKAKALLKGKSMSLTCFYRIEKIAKIAFWRFLLLRKSIIGKSPPASCVMLKLVTLRNAIGNHYSMVIGRSNFFAYSQGSGSCKCADWRAFRCKGTKWQSNKSSRT